MGGCVNCKHYSCSLVPNDPYFDPDFDSMPCKGTMFEHFLKGMVS